LGRSVLIVDSDLAFAQSAQDALEVLGVQVQVMDDASIDVVRKFRPTVLLLNVELARKPMGGFSLCSRIRRDKDLKDLPIFLTSSDATPQSLEKHSKTGDRADEYARKPVAIEELIGRLERMLEAAPDPGPSANGDTGSFDKDWDDPPRTPDLPPPLPRGATGGPPPLPGAGPPPLKKATSDLPPRLPTADLPRAPSEAMPAAPPPLIRVPDEGELWPSAHYEDAFRQATAAEQEQPLGRASPEERINALRNLVKKYQTREKALRGTWDEVMQKGAELARQVAAAALQQQQKDDRTEELIRTRDAAVTRLKTVEGEFRAFQEEITRIFQEKDSEEAAKQEHLQRLEEDNAGLRNQLQGAHEALSDDQRRLKLLQEEIEEIEQLRSENAAANKEIGDLRAHLEMIDAVSADRAQEVNKLQDQVDHLLLDQNSKLAEQAAQHQEELDRVHAEHKERIASMEETHEAQVSLLEHQHREMLQTVTSNHETEANEYEERRAAASEQIRLLNNQVLELQGINERIPDLEAERDEAARRIGELEEELDRSQSDLFERIAELDHYKKSAANLETRSQDLDSSLRLAEKSLKQYKTEAAALKKGYDEANEERMALADQVEKLEDQLERLEEKDRNTSKMLEDERVRSQRAEDVVRKAKEKLESLAADRQRFEQQIAELEDDVATFEAANHDLTTRVDRAEKSERELEERLEEEMVSRAENEARLESEKTARAEVEAQLEEVQADLSRREIELADSYAQTTESRRKAEALAPMLEQAKQRLSAKEAELEGLKRSIEDAGVQIGSLRAEADSVADELADTQEQLQAVQRENAVLRKSEERMRQLETTTAELKRELERATADSKTLAARKKLLKKAAGVLEDARKGFFDHFAEAVADAAVREALNKPTLYTGEVEPLELDGTMSPDYSPPSNVIRQAAMAANLKEAHQDKDTDSAAPFAQLMAELSASEELGSGFDEQFAGETTAENPRLESNPRVGGAALNTPTGRRTYKKKEEEEEEEEEEGSVTEVIRLDKLE
jgi:chromosome segregation ATPase